MLIKGNEIYVLQLNAMALEPEAATLGDAMNGDRREDDDHALTRRPRISATRRRQLRERIFGKRDQCLFC